MCRKPVGQRLSLPRIRIRENSWFQRNLLRNVFQLDQSEPGKEVSIAVNENSHFFPGIPAAPGGGRERNVRSSGGRQARWRLPCSRTTGSLLMRSRFGVSGKVTPGCSVSGWSLNASPSDQGRVAPPSTFTTVPVVNSFLRRNRTASATSSGVPARGTEWATVA